GGGGRRPRRADARPRPGCRWVRAAEAGDGRRQPPRHGPDPDRSCAGGTGPGDGARGPARRRRAVRPGAAGAGLDPAAAAPGGAGAAVDARVGTALAQSLGREVPHDLASAVLDPDVHAALVDVLVIQALDAQARQALRGGWTPLTPEVDQRVARTVRNSFLGL